MPLSRNHRIDRRRRVMLEAVSHDPELAVEQAKIARRKRLRAIEAENDIELNPAYRDPGYSQAVRKACQQRVVQLIPVRRGMVAAALTVLWIGFAALVGAHYALHHLPNNQKVFGKLAIADLFDLTAWNSISHWLSCQLWLLTAFACWMTFNLRRHKLDDYRARYRIWAIAGFAALFLHFDASTSSLLLFGHTINDWAKAEIGYGGWPLVLATTASIIGVLAIRLCSELKTVPVAVTSWIVGLIAVAISALIGTGLIKTQVSAETLRLLSGSLWLGGALAAFQAIAMYLRHTYIQAQKRFLSRYGMELKPIQLKVPKLHWNRRQEVDNSDEGEGEVSQERPRWRDRLPWMGRRDERSYESDDEFEDDVVSKNSQSRKRDKDPTGKDPAGEFLASQQEVQAKRLFGVIPNRELANQSPEYEPIAEDDGGVVDRGLTKKQGWFGLGGNKSAQNETSQESRKARTALQRDNRESEKTRETPKEPSEEKRRWLSWNRKQKNRNEPDNENERKSGEPTIETKAKRAWKKPNLAAAAKMLDPRAALRGWKNQSKTQEAESNQSSVPVEQKKKSGFLGLRGKTRDGDPKQNAPKVSKPETPKRSWMGMFDGLKLKPPSSDNSEPSVSPQPIKPANTPNAPRPSTQSYEEDASSEKHLSKAERKRLRQQQNDRRAA